MSLTLLQVVKRTNIPLIPQQMASSTDHGFFGSWVRIPPSTIINFFRLSPCRPCKILSPVYPGNKTHWILTRPTVYSADLLSRRFRGESVIGLSLGKLLVNLLQVVEWTRTPLIFLNIWPKYSGERSWWQVGVYFKIR